MTGKPEKQYSVNVGTRVSPTDFFVYEDGSLIGLVYTNCTVGDPRNTHQTSPDNVDIGIVKLNANGELDWHFCYGSENEEVGVSLIPVNDGYIIAGTLTSIPEELGDIPMGAKDYEIWILKLDLDGNLLFSRTVPGSAFGYVKDAIQLSSGELLICGFTTSSEGIFSENDGPRRPFILKLTEDGFFSAIYYPLDKNLFFNNQKLLELDSGRFALIGSCNWSGQKPSNAIDTVPARSDGYMAVLTTAGEMVWDKFLGSYDADLLCDIEAIGKDQFILTGEKGKKGSYGKSWIVKLHNSEIIYEQTFLSEPIIDFIYQPSGEFIGLVPVDNTSDTTYYNESSDTSPPDNLVFKLSSISTGIFDSLVKPKSLGYPNPTYGVIDIQKILDQSYDISLWDSEGKLLKKNILFENGKIDISSFASGVYYLEIKSKKETIREKIILQK